MNVSEVQHPVADRPVRLVNVQTVHAQCGTFPTYEAAINWLREKGYSPDDYGCNYANCTVWFRGGINC